MFIYTQASQKLQQYNASYSLQFTPEEYPSPYNSKTYINCEYGKSDSNVLQE